ncbi:MAG: 2-phospho-L-lactate transferase, partial [Chloroflexota bacterium]
LDPQRLTVIVNVGDDFEHLGLSICPDLDTVCYSLAGLSNPATGWGREDESHRALEALGELGGPTWFRLGDRDLGLHLERTRRRRMGQPLSQVTAHICHAYGIPVKVLPVTDDAAPTWVYTTEGELPFQEYFVRRQCQPQVTGFRFQGVEQAKPAPGVLDALHQADLVVICPSNPWVSVDPILAVPGLRQALQGKSVVAVSPIIGGQTVKGPAAKMFAELGIQPSAQAVAGHYERLITGFVLDHVDAEQRPAIESLGIRTLAADTWMKTASDRGRLAKEVVSFAVSLSNQQE